MKGQEHLGFGLVSAGVVIWGAHAAGAPLSMGAAVAGLGAVALGSLAPDIDHPQSLIGNRYPATLTALGLMLLLAPFILKLSSAGGGMFAGMFDELLRWSGPMVTWGLLLTLLGMGMLFLSRFVTESLVHRGPLHSLAAAGVATTLSVVLCALSGLTPLLGFMFGLGWIGHLMADALTPAGLPSLLWPASVTDEENGSRLFGLLLFPVLILGMAGWAYGWRSLTPPQGSNLAASASTSTPATANVVLARQRLREAAPDVERTLQNADHPVVASNARGTSYTWQYLRKPTASSVKVDTITITLDGAGHIVGVDGP